MIDKVLAALTLALLGRSELVLKTSAEFEHPAWAWVVSEGRPDLSLGGVMEFPGYMSVKGDVAPGGKWLVLGLGKFEPPIMGQADGYGLLDSRGLSGAYELRAYEWRGGTYALRKIFKEKATWQVEAWSDDENQALLIGGPPLMVNDQLGAYKLYLLDFARMSLRQLYQADTLLSARFSDSSEGIVAVQQDVVVRRGEAGFRVTRVSLTKAGRVLSKVRTLLP